MPPDEPRFFDDMPDYEDVIDENLRKADRFGRSSMWCFAVSIICGVIALAIHLWSVS